MVNNIVDGQQYFKKTLEQFYRSTTWKKATTHLNITPSLSNVSDERPSLAHISYGQLYASCPCGGAEFVWKDGPLLTMCGSCGNSDINGKMRRVVLPDNLDDIADVLFKRPVASNRNWFPHETIEDLIKENEEHLA